MRIMAGQGQMEYSNIKVWYKNNEFHRLDGPAVIYANGSEHWYIEGVNYSEEDFNAKIDSMKLGKELFTL